LTSPPATRGASWGAARGAAGFLLLLLTLVTIGCSQTPRLENTFESDEALARAVLEGVAKNDSEGLLRLAVTRDEYVRLVWPTLPVSRPEVGMPVDYVWQDTLTKSRGYLAQTLSQHGGKQYNLIRVESQGETTEHGTHTISRKTQLVVRDADQKEQTIRFFGSIIRQDGRSKVFSFIVD
jgi:hypothetical protein